MIMQFIQQLSPFINCHLSFINCTIECIECITQIYNMLTASPAYSSLTVYYSTFYEEGGEGPRARQRH